MKDVNIKNNLGNPYLTREKNTGIWKVCFKYPTLEGKIKKYYYSDGLNDIRFFELDKDNKKKVNKDGAIIRNIKEREKLAQKRIDRLVKDQNELEFSIQGGDFITGDTDRPIVTLMREFIEFKKLEGNMKLRSTNCYRAFVNTYELYLIDKGVLNILLKNVDKEHFTNFYNYLINEAGISKSYRDSFNVFFKSFYKHLIEYKELDIKDPLVTFKKIHKGQTNLHKATDISNIRGVIDELKAYNYHVGLMYEFIFFTLHRIDTIVAIQRKDIDLDNNLIHLSSNIVKNNEKLSISIAEPLQDILCKYLSENEVNANDYMFGRNANGITKLFAENKNHAFNFSNKFSYYKKSRIKNGEKTLLDINSTLYSAKHSGVKFLLDSGLTPNQIISITGHKNVEQLGTYAKDYQPIKVQFPEVPTF